MVRRYRASADLRLIQEHIRGLWAVDGPLAPIHPGDIVWWTHQHEKPRDEWERRIRLWFDGDELVGWAFLNPPDSVDAFPRADLRGSSLHGQMLDWLVEEVALARAGGDSVSVLETYALDRHEATTRLLRERGFEPAGDGYDHNVHRLAHLAPVEVAPGYELRTVADGIDVSARVAAHRAAFDPSKVTEISYGVLMGEGTYDASLDHGVVAPDGSLAAFCLAWYDAPTRSGLLEPVGTHPDHRRRGLARAACGAALRALAGRGARHCVVLSWSGERGATELYRSIGFETVARHVGWKAPIVGEAVA